RAHDPAPAQAQVGAEHPAALEPEQEALADRLHPLEPPPVEQRRVDRGAGARVRELDLEPLADERLEAAGGAVGGVALGHGLRPQHRPARPGEEARLDEERKRVAVADRGAVEALHGQPPRPARAHVRHERRERRAKPRLLRLAQRDERAAAALDVERSLAAEEHDPGAGDAGRARPGAPRPRERGAVGLSRIGRGEDARLLLLAGVARLAQALDRSPERELRAAESLDEVAAAAEPERLERAQLAVDGAVAARDALGADGV